jgi:dihydroflavonol-4-reductase
MKIFLTGGTGFIGQPLTKTLLSRGWDVTVLVRKPESPSAQAISNMGAHLAAGDVTKRESMRSAMQGADIVIHNAGVYEYGVNKAGKQNMQAINVTGTENVLGLAHELRIARTVYVSTIQAFGETGCQPRDETFPRQTPCCTAYERTKTEAHKIACRYQSQGLPLIIVMPHAVIGPNDHSAFGYFMRLYINRSLPPICWSPDSIFAAVYIDDLVEGIVLAAEKGRIGEAYYLCGEVTTFHDILDIWTKKPGAFKSRLWLPDKLAAILFAPLEPFQRWCGLPAFISRETVKGSSTNWYYVSDKAKSALGWSHRSAQDLWNTTIDQEIALLANRKGQNLLQRLKPFDTLIS